MTRDFSFLKLYKNNFALAKTAEDTPISSIRYGGFIQMKPNETFLQITSSTSNIFFVGGIQVDLADCSDTVIQNIDANFYYTGFVDSNGINQISFEFGNIGTDYWTKPLHLRITDLVNGNIWYSNGFLVTNYQSALSARFDYTNATKIHNISYDLAPYVQSIRFSGCYDNGAANKRDLKQYINANGNQVNYRTITTFLRKYNLDAVDNFINDRLEILFSHQTVYLDNEFIVASDYKIDDRKGTENFYRGEFLINPQGQQYTFAYQIYEALDLITFSPVGDYAPQVHIYIRTFNSKFSLPFGSNPPITTNKKFNNKFSDVFGG